jgi:hypothetical protein
MKREGKWLSAEDHCCLPSPRLYLTRVAGLVFNFSRTIVPDKILALARDGRHARRHRAPKLSARESKCSSTT